MDFISPDMQGRVFMNEKRKRAALAAISLTDSTAANSWPQPPSIRNKTTARRSGFYRLSDWEFLSSKTIAAVRGDICVKSFLLSRAPNDSDDFRSLGGASLTGRADQSEGGRVPAYSFHLRKEEQR